MTTRHFCVLKSSGNLLQVSLEDVPAPEQRPADQGASGVSGHSGDTQAELRGWEGAVATSGQVSVCWRR